MVVATSSVAGPVVGIEDFAQSPGIVAASGLDNSAVPEDQSHVLEDSVTLSCDIVPENIAPRIYFHSGNFFAPSDSRTDTGEKEQTADASGMWKRTNRLSREACAGRT